jgi:hypothetical protein
MPGPDVGALSNTATWKKNQPTSVRSPYVSEGDLGFFSFQRKRYGAFFLALQTHSRHIFVAPIANTKAQSIYKAISLMLKVIEQTPLTKKTVLFMFLKTNRIPGQSICQHQKITF